MVEKAIQHEAEPSAVWLSRPHHECCISHTARGNRALIDLWYMRGCIKGTDSTHCTLVLHSGSMENKRDGQQPAIKKKRLSLSRKQPLQELNTTRFGSPTKSDTYLSAAEGVIPDNTRLNTKWAISTFLSWIKERNDRVDASEQLDTAILSSKDTDEISRVLRLFVLEVRKVDGERYPPGSIRNLVSGINRELTKNGAHFSIMDKSDRRFRQLHLTLDSVSSELHRSGVGADKKSAVVISSEVENMCWNVGSLGWSSPRILQQTVFFYTGLQFVLRGVTEQHDLKVAQLTRVPLDRGVYSSDVFYEYTEYISKNNLHRFTESKRKNKVVRAYAKPDSDRCYVRLLDRYLPLLPPDCEYLYMRPCLSFPKDPSQLAYCRQRVGVNVLKKFVDNITSAAGASGYTNHCLRATAMSRMFNQGVPEKIIAEKSGHRSIDGLRAYERVSTDSDKAASSIISDPTKSFKDLKSEDQKDRLIGLPSTLPGFSGCNNCTINFNITYGK